jgi:hypothetical protein
VVAVSAGARLGRRRESHLIAPVAPPQLTKDAGPLEIDRALGELADKVNDALPQGVYRADVNLVSGTNTINHGLLRKPVLVQVCPKTAVAAFAWGWDPNQSSPRPTMTTTITVVGGPITARIEVS